MDQELMRKWGLLDAIASAGDDTGAEDDMFISSVKDANTLLQMHMLNPRDAKYRKRLVGYITNPSNKVIVEPDVYHNLIMDLFRCGDYYAAVDVCKFVLSFAPMNMDILADMMKACGDSCQFELGEKYLEKANEIPKDKWSWRLYLYSVDFLKTKLQAYPTDQEVFSRAETLAKQYMQYFKLDEHGYNQLAEIYVCANKRGMAIDTLYDFIFVKQPEERVGSRLICAQCCVTLLNLLDVSNDYTRIIEICDRGLDCTTQEQPSASIGFFIYRKALAMDAMLRSKNYKEGDVLEAMLNYQVAYDLNQDRAYASTIEKRYALLRAYVPSDKFKPLVKRKLYVEQPEGYESEND